MTHDERIGSFREQKMRRFLNRALSSAVWPALLVLGGCAGVPKTQLQAYSTAYDDLQSAATAVYADAAPAIASGSPATPVQFLDTLGPPTLDRNGCGAAVAAVDSLRARCHALAAARAYNQALLELSAGRRTEDVLSQIDGAVASLTTLAGLVPAAGAAPVIATLNAVAEPLKAILGEALKVRDRLALQDSLLKGEPHLRSLILALRADAADLYVVHRAFAERGLQKAKNDIDRDLNQAFQQVASRGAPTDPAVAGSLSWLKDKFETTFSASEPQPGHRLKDVPFSSVAGALPFDQSSAQLIERQILAASEDVAKFRAVGIRYKASVLALEGFDKLIASWAQSLTDVVAATKQPFSTGGSIEQTLQSLMTVRDQAREVKRILDAKKGS